jgi:hypothetical protein
MIGAMARPAETTAATQKVLAELERRQFLLQAGREFPSIANIAVGAEIKGSWWAHPQSNLIYWVCQDLDDDPRVAEAKLLAGKVTALWHTVWADVAAIALARERWQLDGLSSAAKRLLARVDDGDVRTDALEWRGDEKLGDVCRALEKRLLVKSEELHTESGAHAKRLGSWQRWWDGKRGGALPDAESARDRIEALVGDARLLPWTTRSRAKR